MQLNNHFLLSGINFFLYSVFVLFFKVKTIPVTCCTERFSEFWSHWHFIRLNLFIIMEPLMQRLVIKESVFKLSFKTKLLLLKSLSTSAYPRQVMINTKGVDISGYLISTFIFWKNMLLIRDSPHLNSFEVSSINCMLS